MLLLLGMVGLRSESFRGGHLELKMWCLTSRISNVKQDCYSMYLLECLINASQKLQETQQETMVAMMLDVTLKCTAHMLSEQ